MSSSIPPPALNGGLYTGEPFKGPWGNVPVVPDTDYMINVNLRSARPPPEALTQYPGGRGRATMCKRCRGCACLTGPRE